MPTLIIRRSKKVHDLYLTCNSEKVYRVFRFGQEVLNTLDYDQASDHFNSLELI